MRLFCFPFFQLLYLVPLSLNLIHFYLHPYKFVSLLVIKEMCRVVNGLGQAEFFH